MDLNVFQNVIYNLFEMKTKKLTILSPNKFTLFENYQLIWHEIALHFHLNSWAEIEERM